MNDFLTLKDGCVYFCRGVLLSLVAPTIGCWPFAFAVIVKQLLLTCFLMKCFKNNIGMGSEQKHLKQV
jgi:hypothetical protein